MAGTTAQRFAAGLAPAVAAVNGWAGARGSAFAHD
jgi:hypothetical protein